jgi:methionyl-tRNA formyltransferase
MEEEIRVLTPQRPWGEGFMENLRALDPELFVVVAYGHILKPEVLEIAPLGSINVHASLLPELRGAAPVNWAIMRGYARSGVTIMRMVEAMDAGPLLLQAPEDIGETETATELGTRLSEVGAEILIEALALMDGGIQEEVEQDHSRATYAPKLDRETARIDWSLPARQVANHIRGLDRIPGAWTVLEQDPVKLFCPRKDPEYAHRALPGSILEADPTSGLLVATGEGAVVVGEIQPPGRRRMRAEEWIHGRSLHEGARFE